MRYLRLAHSTFHTDNNMLPKRQLKFLSNRWQQTTLNYSPWETTAHHWTQELENITLAFPFKQIARDHKTKRTDINTFSNRQMATFPWSKPTWSYHTPFHADNERPLKIQEIRKPSNRLPLMSISTLKWRQQKTLKDCEHRCTHWKIAEDKPQYKVNWRYRHQRRQKNLKDCEHHCTLRQMTDDKSQWDKFNWRYKPPYMKDHSLLFLFILQVITSYLELTRKAMLWPGPLMKTTLSPR